MPDLEQIRQALAHNLDAIPGVQVSAYMLSNPTPPAIEIQPAETVYDETFGRGMDTWTLTIRAHVAQTLDVGAQRRLDRMLAPAGASSVKARAESDRSLGGLVEDLRVTRCAGYRVFVREGGAQTVGSEWTVQVLAPGLDDDPPDDPDDDGGED